MGLVPFPHCAMVAVIESLRATLALNELKLFPAALEKLPNLSPLPAFCKADVRFDACCPGGDTDV